MNKTHVVSVRLTIEDLAKARDALITKGIPLADLTTISNILKLTFYYGIIHLSKDDAKSPASQASISFIQQKFEQNKR